MNIKNFMLFLCGINTVVARNEIPQSPCPSVFTYQLNDNGDVTGNIKVIILPSYEMPLKLSVEMTISAYVTGNYAGKLILKDNKDVIAQKIFKGDPVPINYNVLFPIPSPLPLVKNIFLNEDELCTGPEAPGGVVTKIRLQHTLFPVTPLGVEPHRPGDQDLVKPTPPRQPNPFFPPTGRPATPEVDVTEKNPQNHVSSDQCGKPVIPNLLVVNGIETSRGEWPWMSALFKLETDGNFGFHCSGTLINHKHVVTAGHCIKFHNHVQQTTETLVVYLGKFNLTQVVEKDSMFSEIEEIHIHPDFDLKKYDADLAVLVLKTWVIFNSYIQPVCYWNFSPALEPIVGELGTVVGWGRNEKGDRVTSTPRMVRIPIVSQEECLRSESDLVKFTSARTLCAGFRNGSGPCNGDSGGGLVLPVEDSSGKRWYLRGVVSLSLLDKSVYSCDLKQYVVYTDVAKYSSWLQKFLN